MNLRSEPLREISLEDVQAHPEIITDLLMSHSDMALILERHGDVVRFAKMRTHAPETRHSLDKAQAEHRRRKAQGYTREEAFADFSAAQEAIARQSVD